MARLRRVIVTHTTADVPNANTGAHFDLQLFKDGALRWQEEFPDHPYDERERGRTDQYEFNILQADLDTEDAYRIRMKMKTTSNAWLPKSIWAIGETEFGEWVVLAANPNWNFASDRWFDRGSGSIGQDAYWLN